MGVEPVVDALRHLGRDGGVKEVGRTYLYGAGTCHDELYGVRGAGYASKAYDGDINGLGHLIHHAQGYGLDARTGEASRADAEHTLALLYVDGGAHEGVDKAHGVGSLCLHGLGYAHDVGYVGREFHYEGLAIGLAHGTHHAGGSLGGNAEGHAAVVHVGAGDVQFYGVDVLQGVYALGTTGIVLGRGTGHVDYHLRVYLAYLGIDGFAEVLYALVLQAHAVEHAAWGFGHTGVVVALAGQEGGSLHYDATYGGEVHHVLEFYAVAEGATGRHYGVLHLKGPYACTEICHTYYYSQVSSLMSNTGPSVQTHTLPFTA